MNANQHVISVDDSVEQMVDKLQAIEKEMSAERGDFALFGLFLREEAPGRWDLLVSAPWLAAHSVDDLRYVINTVQPRLDVEEWLLVSRVVVLEKDNPVLSSIQKLVKTEHSRFVLQNSTFNGMRFRHAYVITSGTG